MAGVGLINRRRAIQAYPTMSDFIRFADPVVKAILIAKGVSSDGVNISYDDAAAVTGISTWFKGNAEITSFDELKYFTSVKSLVQGAFQGCSNLISVNVENITTFNPLVFSQSGIVRMNTFGNVTTTSSQLFASCTSLVSVTIPASVTTISYRTFYLCTQLTGDIELLSVSVVGESAFQSTKITSCSMPSITTIGTTAFSGCTKLTSIDIRNAKTINASAFNGCKALTKIELGENITSIGWRAFFECSAAKAIICRATTPPSLASEAFQNTSCSIYVPDSAVDTYTAASGWSTYASRIKGISEYTG